MVLIQGKRTFLETTFSIIFLGGTGVWLIGRTSYHVGASGLIFGYFGFLVALGIFKRSISSMLISIFTIFVYGGLFIGLLPTLSHISWEGHFSGFLAGVLAAWFERKNKQ